MERTCYNCENISLCFAFRLLFYTILKELPINIDGDSAPGKMQDVPKSLAGCCLEYKQHSKNE